MFAQVLLVALAVVNLLPGVVAFAPHRALSLYGQRIDTPTLAVLIRHRAVLLACVGAGLVWAAFDRRVLWPALALAAVSKVAYLSIGFQVGLTQALRRIAVVDVVALVLLAGVAIEAST